MDEAITDRVGLIGLGLVGTAMAERLLAEDFGLVGFDIDSAKCEHLERLGGKVAASSGAVAEQTARIVLSLPDTGAVRQVVQGPDGILEAKSLPEYIIDTTTGDPEETMTLAQTLAKRQIHFLDSTISGSSRQVANGEAVLMVGGDRMAFEACKDIFEALARKVFYLGPSGNGSKAKLASNLVLGLNRLALAEGLVFARRLGLDPTAFLKLLKATPAYSVVMDVKGEKMLTGDFEPESRIRQHHKDVALILKYAERAGQELPLSAVHLDVLAKAIAAGEGEMDNAAVIREIERRSKL